MRNNLPPHQKDPQHRWQPTNDWPNKFTKSFRLRCQCILGVILVVCGLCGGTLLIHNTWTHFGRDTASVKTRCEGSWPRTIPTFDIIWDVAKIICIRTCLECGRGLCRIRAAACPMLAHLSETALPPTQKTPYLSSQCPSACRNVWNLLAFLNFKFAVEYIRAVANFKVADEKNTHHVHLWI